MQNVPHVIHNPDLPSAPDVRNHRYAQEPPAVVDARALVLLRLEAAASLLDVSKTTLYRLVGRREIRFHRISGSLRFSPHDLLQLLDATRVEPNPPNSTTL